MLDTWLPLLGAFLFFSLLHVLVVHWVEPVYPRAFKLSRGLSAAILTVVGVAALASAYPRWEEAFLYRHERGDWMRYGLILVYGHLWSDLFWMWVGKRYFEITPRTDLILHHLLGVFGFGFALWMRVGYAIALFTMVTEMLPVTTGLAAWGKRLGSQKVVDRADRLRLYVLAWLRLPLWFVLLVLVSYVFVLGKTSPLTVAYSVALGGLCLLIALDLYWVKKCRERVDFY